MELWPAIDIREGRCVRLRRGDFGEETGYGTPEEVAAAYLEAGARRLHVVDLDAARTGEAVNRSVVLRIAQLAAGREVPVQVGGGVRSLEAAAALLDGGARRVVLGTAALEDPELVGECSQRWPGRIVVGLDHRRLGGAGRSGAGELAPRELALRGWTEASGVMLTDALGALEGLALAGVVVTDITRDGTGAGPDLNGLRAALRATSQAVIASGGVGSVADLRALAALEEDGRRLDGVVVGRALLSGAIALADAEAAVVEA